MHIKPFIRGILSRIPFFRNILKMKGGTSSARYCYSVWLRHLVLLNKNGMKAHPKVVAEMGPGRSLGMGISALLTGTDKYYGFDIVKYSDIEKNLNIFRELVELFKDKKPIPDQSEFPEVRPKLVDYSFPSKILNNEYLQTMLDPKRLANIEDAIKNINRNTYESRIKISYIAPWVDVKMINPNSVDLIFSQAAMEHILEVQKAYNVMYAWLKPEGYLSHQIDYRSHGLHKRWYGHWTYSDFSWKILMNGRLYAINRLPHTSHISMLKTAGFEIIEKTKDYDKTEINKSTLNQKFRNFDKEDYFTLCAHIIARKH